MTAAIDITTEQRKMLLALLRRFIPGVAVWAYGSRVKWTARPNSDLDLVAFTTPAQRHLVSELKEALSESNLPFLVDLHVWDEVPERFHEIIRKEYVVLQKAEDKVALQEEKKKKAGMGGEWATFRLGSVCSKIGSGATPRGGSSVYLDKGEVTLIRSQNVYNDGFHHDGLTYLTEQHASELANVEVVESDVLLNITGDSVARSCQVDPNVLPARVNQHVAIIRPDPTVLWPRFLRYYLVSPAMQAEMLSLAGAVATRNALTKGMIESFEILAPIDLHEQRAIAHILGTLDDKIELNRQMNKTLEAMAQALFKSWFVDFDPVIDNALAAGNPIPEDLKERAAHRESLGDARKPLPEEIQKLFPDEFEHTEELGWIPRGWKVKTLDELVNVIGGGMPKTTVEKYWDGNIPWFSVVDAPDVSDVFVIDTKKHISQLGIEKSSTKILPLGTTIISARGTVGKCAMVGVPMAMNQFCYGIRGKNGISDVFVYYSIREQVADLQRSGHGSVFNTITGDTFKTIRMTTGSVNITQELEKSIKPFFDKILDNLFHSKDLSKLRDTLLPKLLSGELRIPEAEKLMEKIGFLSVIRKTEKRSQSSLLKL